MLTVQGLSKRFGNFTAVDDIDLDVGPGEIFGFLGPNGAGKTTTIKMLAGLLKPDSGTIHIQGRSLSKEPQWCKQQTGYIPDRPYLYEKLTGMEFLQFVGSLYSIDERRFNEKVERFFPLFDLDDWRHHLIESYSHGMRQKLIMISAFMLEPPLIVVDEPMVGLDPKSARIVKVLLKEHATHGGSVFLSTHSLDVAQELCDKIAIILQGRIIATGNLDTLRREAQTEKKGLEDIFLQLTGVHELRDVVQELRRTSARDE